MENRPKKSITLTKVTLVSVLVVSFMIFLIIQEGYREIKIRNQRRPDVQERISQWLEKQKVVNVIFKECNISSTRKEGISSCWVIIDPLQLPMQILCWKEECHRER